MYPKYFIVICILLLFSCKEIKQLIEQDELSTAVSVPSMPYGKFNASSRTIELNWSNQNKDSYGYVLYRAVGSDELYTECFRSGVTDPGYIDYDIDFMTDYYYKLAFLGPDGEAGAKSVGKMISTPPPVVRNVVLENNADSIVITWDAIPGVDSYNVYLKSYSTSLIGNGIAENSYTYTPGYYIENPKTFTFTVRAVWSSMKSEESRAYSIVFSTEPDVAKPEKPVLIDSSYKEVSFSWSPVESAVLYNVYRSSWNGGHISYAKRIALNVAATQYNDSELDAAEGYCYFVEAITNEGLRSDRSEFLFVQIEPLPLIDGISIVEKADGSGVDISWNPSTNPDFSYEVVIKRTLDDYVYRTISLTDTAYSYTYPYLNRWYVIGVNHVYKNRRSPDNYVFQHWILDKPVLTRTGSTDLSIVRWNMDDDTPDDIEMNIRRVKKSDSTEALFPVSFSMPYEDRLNDFLYQFEDTSFQYDTEYSYSVVTSRNGQSIESDPVNVTVSGAVQSFEIQSRGAVDSLFLSWEKLISADSYNLYRSTSAIGPYLLIGNSMEESFLDSGLNKGFDYFYKITAVKNGIEGASNTVLKGTVWGYKPQVPSVEYHSDTPDSSYFKINLDYEDSYAYIIDVQYDADGNGVFTDPGDESFRLTAEDSTEYIPMLPVKYIPRPEQAGDFYFRITPCLIENSTIHETVSASDWSGKYTHGAGH